MTDEHTALALVFVFILGFVCGLCYALIILLRNRRGK